MTEPSKTECSPRGNATCLWNLHCQGGTRKFSLFDTPLAKQACAEVLKGQSYPLLPFNGKIRTIVDIGANVGAATVFFALHYPDAQVLSFEPSPDSFALLSANTSDLTQVRCFNFGLFDQDRESTLYLGKDDAVEDSIGRSQEQSQRAVPIKLRAAKEAMTSAGVQCIELLKMDTEGCEVPILRSLVPLLSLNIGVIYIEFHSERDRHEIDRLLFPTHLLFRGKISKPHRGELCYVSRRFVPEAILKASEISI